MHPAESEFPNFMIGEIETEFDNILACLSGTQMVSNSEAQKSRDTFSSWCVIGWAAWLALWVCPP